MRGGRYAKKRRTSTQRSFMLVMAVLGFFAVFYWASDRTGNGIPLPESEEIRVYFLDVGQGDAILIQSAENAVLIDGGEYTAQKALLSYLREAGVTTLDFVVATHPHSDHIGGLPEVIGAFTVNQVLMPDVTHNTESFEKLMDAIEEQNIPLTVATAGEVYTAGPIRLEVLAPSGGGYEDLNDYSLVMRMPYGGTAFMFTGDAGHLSEREMLDSDYDLRANVLKAGHHGSNTATGESFLTAVAPAAVVISCGKDNSYGHPHAGTLKKLADKGIPVYRTDESGSIIMGTDGNVIRLYGQPKE